MGGLGHLGELVAGRNVIIIGENDEKVGGDWPGRIGAEKTENHLRNMCPVVTILYPPKQHKDLRRWVTDGLGLEAFIEYAEKYGGKTIKVSEQENVLANDRPGVVARAFIAKLYPDGLVRSGEAWYTYDSEGWIIETGREMMVTSIFKFMDETQYRDVDGRSKTEVVKPLKVTTTSVHAVLGMIKASVPGPNRQPVWLDDRAGAADQVLLFANGMLPVANYLRGDDTILPHDSQLFSTTRLPFAYDPTATCPRWDAWLQETLGDDRCKIALLQEWFGYNMIPDTQYEKMLLMLGPTRSGKSTALTVLNGLLGVQNAEATSFLALGQTFGMTSLIGKLAAILPDARLPDQNRMACLSNLLQIVGNDRVMIQRKYKEAVSKQLNCRITIATNQLPNLPDDSLALAARLMFITFTQSFQGHEETSLKSHLATELPGITLWALKGLKRLSENGRFTEPANARQMAEDFTNLVNPIAEYADTWIRNATAEQIPVEAIWHTWTLFANERDINRHNKQWLWNQLKVRFPHIDRYTDISQPKPVKMISGITVHDWTPNADQHRRTG
jgi:putative DNA primase/helicase